MDTYGKFKAKRTFYNGLWFDSNLEARVAESLDALGVSWEYHADCFRDRRFPYGQYTPDFKLQDGSYVEVAGVFDDRHRSNMDVLARILRDGGIAPAIAVVDGTGGARWVVCRGSKWTPPWRGTNLFDAVAVRHGTKR